MDCAGTQYNISISENIINNNSGNGIYFYNGDCNTCTIFNNTIYGSNIGIYLSDYVTDEYDKFNINNNKIYKNRKHGILLSEFDFSNVSKNTINDNGFTGNYDGIYIQRNSDNNRFWENIISNNTRYGIFLNQSSNDWFDFYNNTALLAWRHNKPTKRMARVDT